MALKLFWVFGIGAFMIPVLLLMFALGYLLQFLAYLQRRWLWGAVLLLCCMGLASTFEMDFRLLRHLQKILNAPSVGGFIGQFLEQYVLHYVGKVGATIVLGAVYVISLIYLTNFKLGEWCRQCWAARFGGAKPASTAGENDLERRARDLEKQARKLQEQVEKSSKSRRHQGSRTRRSGRRHAARARTHRARPERPPGQTRRTPQKTAARPGQRTCPRR